MSVFDKHWTDAEIAAYGQTLLDEFHRKSALQNLTNVQATTFFLNPDSLGCTTEPSSMEKAIRRKLFEILPSHIFNRLPPDMAHTFRGLGDLAYGIDGGFRVIFSRPDDKFSLAERISRSTRIQTDDLAIDPTQPSFGFDNLALKERVLEVFNSLPNGGVSLLKVLGAFDQVQYLSMLGAKRTFLAEGGDAKTVDLHQAAFHVRAFTAGAIPHEYVGFAIEYGLPQSSIITAYAKIMNRLADLGFAAKEAVPGGARYPNMSIENLLQGMSHLLDEYGNQITAKNGEVFRTLHTAITTPECLQGDERAKLRQTTLTQTHQFMEHFIVFQTFNGLKTLMGDNTLKYIPQKNNDTFARVNRLLQANLS
jgi:hypothetical protein